MITCGIDRQAANTLHEAYWSKNWAIKQIANDQTIKEVDDKKWLYNPISKFWYYLKTDKDKFSTLVQGSASYCFDTWVANIVTDRPQITGQFHDEVILTVKKGFREEIIKFLDSTIKKTNEFLKLNRQLGIGIEFGDKYSEIH